MTYDPNNIFARILRKEIPCTPIYEDEQVLAFFDIAPKSKVHILLIPKGAFIHFHDFCTRATSEHIVHFFKVAAQLCEAHGLTQSGYRVISNAGLNGGQEVPHFHIHLCGGSRLGAMA